MADKKKEYELKEAATRAFFDAMSANAPELKGVAVLLKDGQIYSAYSLSYSFAAHKHEKADTVLFNQVAARYGDKIPKVLMRVEAVEDEKNAGQPRLVIGKNGL